MRFKVAALLVVMGAVALLLGPNPGLSQPGGGYPGEGPGGYSGGPSRYFEMYSQGRGFFYNEVTDPDRRARLMQFAQQAGITDGKIDAQQYDAYRQMFFGRGGSSGGYGRGPSPGGPPIGGPPGNMMSGSPSGNMMMTGSMDPNALFNQFSGGRDVLRRSDLRDPMQQAMFDRIAQGMGLTSGEISRQQFLSAVQQFQGMSMRGGPGSGWSGGPSSGWSGGPGSGWSGSRGGTDDASIERRFRERDRNGDGLLNYDEMSDTLRAEREKWDTNGDGFIDLNEYKAYMQARFQSRQQQSGGGGPSQGSGWQGNPWSQLPPAPAEEDKKPVVYRAGKLPPGIPNWFASLDTDGDGQIGLYEWKNSRFSLDDFALLDRNGDGFITIAEALAYANAAKPGDPLAGRGPSGMMANRGFGSGGPSGMMSSRGPGGPGWGDRSSSGWGDRGSDRRGPGGPGWGDRGRGPGSDPRSNAASFEPRSTYGGGR
jgi:Ca2+-binding EF-hand superfamily protein